MNRMQELSLNTAGMTVSQMEGYGSELIAWQRAINWCIGDLAIEARRQLGDNYTQVFPETVSPGLIARCEAVAKSYRPEDRNPLATWTIHMRHANDRDRIQKVKDAVDAGRTSDEESAEAGRTRRESQPENGSRWLLAVDVNYFLHRFWFSGAGVEAAQGVASWIQRTAERLKEKD